MGEPKDETKTGGWAVAYRFKGTHKGEFCEDANGVDESTARKVFGRCIRAAELGLKVEGVEIDAVRLLKKQTRWALLPANRYAAEREAQCFSWETVQQHDVGVVERWKAIPGTAPYHDETIPLGVPCHPGACGGDGCAMHSGFPRDENGLCIEGRRAVKVLDLIVVPRAMQERWGLPATLTPEEVEENHAAVVIDLVNRGKGEGITDEQLDRVVRVLGRKTGGMNEESPREGQEVENG